MRLGELLDPRCVLVPLKGKTVRDATRLLGRTLVAAGAVEEGPLLELLKAEWPEDVVTAPGRAFLPHFRTDAAKRVAVALGVTAEPVTLGDDPARTARVIVLVVGPRAEASAYLRAMRAVARALASDETLEGLHRAARAADVLGLPGIAEGTVPDEVTVHDLMTRNVTTVSPETPLRDAAQVMLEKGVAAIPVTGSAGEVVGLLHDGHLLRFLLPGIVSALSTGQVRAVRRKGKGTSPTGEERVKDVMDRSVLCLEEDQTVADVAALMLAKAVDRFPVTRDGALVGFLTRGDIVRKLLRP